MPSTFVHALLPGTCAVMGNEALGVIDFERGVKLIGTSGWAYPSWKPGFYPEKLAQTKFLTYYATQLNTVEVNLTFRQLLKETTAAKWISQTPDGFRFGIKAHQVITHIKRL